MTSALSQQDILESMVAVIDAAQAPINTKVARHSSLLLLSLTLMLPNTKPNPQP